MNFESCHIQGKRFYVYEMSHFLNSGYLSKPYKRQRRFLLIEYINEPRVIIEILSFTSYNLEAAEEKGAIP